MPGYKTIAIHLDRAAERRRQVEAALIAVGGPNEILAAVDGATLSRSEIAAVYARSRWQPRYPFELNAAEIGCFLSHRLAWQRILSDGLDFALVIEDDVAIEPDRFADTLRFAVMNRPHWQFVHLPLAHRPVSGSLLATDGRCELREPVVPPLRTSGQLVSRAAAETLLASSLPFDRPVDAFLQMTWITKVPIATISPSGISGVSASLGGSMVSTGRRSVSERIRREILRPIYRAEIAGFGVARAAFAAVRRSSRHRSPNS